MVRAENFKVALLLISVITSLAASTLVFTFTNASKVTVANTFEATVYSDVDNVFVRGKATAYDYNCNDPPRIKELVEGDCPPMAMSQQIGSGRVVAFGDVTESRLANVSDNYVSLMDAIFQWLSSSQANVLWFDGYGAYCNSGVCLNLITKLKARGYTIIGDSTTPITSELLAPYDILVLPELQLGNGQEGGYPDLLPDADVAVIKSFVEGGKGLLVMCGSDFFPAIGVGGNFYKVMNKVLVSLHFGSGGNLFGFQSDSVYDDKNNGDERAGGRDVPIPGGNRQYTPIVDVNTAHPIGATYYALTGRTDVRAYGGCSIIRLGPGMSIVTIPDYQVGMPGETITYRVKVFNTGEPITGAENVDLTIDLAVEDDHGWSKTLDNYVLSVPQGENETTILRVTIPSGASLATDDTIVVTATAREFPSAGFPYQVTMSYTCIACAGKRLEVTEDAFVADNDPNGNYGNRNYVRIGRHSTAWQYAYLKFDDLAEIPSGASITEARLYLFCSRAQGAAQEILCTPVVDDSWSENGINWTNKPDNGAILDTKIASLGSEDEPEAYWWDVTSFVQQEFAGDQIASFCMLPPDNCAPQNYREFEARDWWDSRVHPFLRIIYGVAENRKVSVSILPSSKGGLPGSSLSYTVTVKNEGNVSDTYSLTTADNASWSRTISPTSLPLAAGASGTATLTVAIPSGAENNARDNVRVTATGTGVSAESSCIARVGGPGVEVSISPTSKDGARGAALTYTVTVTNTGSVADNYVLTKSDNASWSLSLSPSTPLPLAAGASGIATLTVTISASAENNTQDSVTVTATSQTDSSVSDSASCTARCVENENVVPEGVQVTISPASKSGNPGERLDFLVTFTNTGTATGTFDLNASDTENWGPTLAVTPPRITLAGGASRTIGLSITIPSTAAAGDSATITVTAAGTSTTCTATAQAGGGISPFVYVGAVVVIVAIIAAVIVIKPF